MVEVKDTPFPFYLPATRYTRSGSIIVIEYEYLQDGFGPVRPDFGASLPPGFRAGWMELPIRPPSPPHWTGR